MKPTTLPKGTTPEQWEAYEKELAAHTALYEESKPHPRDFDNDDDFNKAHNKWSFEFWQTRPNKPNYYRANND